MANLHIVPNSVSVQTVLGHGHHAMQCAIVRRDKQVLAVYPAYLNGGRIPSVREVQKDARWDVKPVAVAAPADTFTYDYLMGLQDTAAYRAHKARVLVEQAARMDAMGEIYFAWEDRVKAVAQQTEAALIFSRIAGVRGLFD